MRDITLGDTFYHAFTTRAFATGIPTVLAGTPVLKVLEENNATPISGAAVTVSVDSASVVGLNEAKIIATSGNGFETGKSYSIFISTGTVDSVSVIGEVVGQFTIAKSAAAIDLANGTDGLGVIVSKVDTVDSEIGTIDTEVGVIDGIVDAIKLETDKLTLGNAGAGAAGSIIEEIEDIVAALATVDTEVGVIDGVVDAIKLETDKLTLGNAGTGAAGSIIEEIEDIITRGDSAWVTGPDAATIADAVWNEVKSGHTGSTTFGDLATDLDTVLTNLADVPTVAEFEARTIVSANYALASVLGALNDAAAAGDPTSADTLMQYLKQLINIMIGTVGVGTWPAEQPPGNAINFAEVLRAIYEDTNATDTIVVGTTPWSDAEKEDIRDALGVVGAKSPASAGQLQALDAVADAIKVETLSLDGTKIPDILSLANINTEVDRALNVTTYGELGTGAPALTESMQYKLSFIYKMVRNRKVSTAILFTLFNDGGVDEGQRSTLSDDDVTAESTELVTGV